MKQRIGIIGCGWLGLPLAKHLVNNGFDVHGSTTRPDKIQLLQKANITPYVIQISPKGITGDIEACLSGCQTLVLNIPPGLRKDPKYDYTQSMRHLVQYVASSTIKNVLFVSSTSVYDDAHNFPVITEISATSNSAKALQLLHAEALFQDNTNFKTTVLRFSGLFAEDRHPINFLSGKTNLKHADAPVNLIHRNDCIAILSKLIEHNIGNAVLNASAPTHPTKATYYTTVAKALKIPVPEFDLNAESKGKVIDASKLVQLLDYEFKVNL